MQTTAQPKSAGEVVCEVEVASACQPLRDPGPDFVEQLGQPDQHRDAEHEAPGDEAAGRCQRNERLEIPPQFVEAGAGLLPQLCKVFSLPSALLLRRFVLRVCAFSSPFSVASIGAPAGPASDRRAFPRASGTSFHPRQVATHAALRPRICRTVDGGSCAA